VEASVFLSPNFVHFLSVLLTVSENMVIPWWGRRVTQTTKWRTELFSFLFDWI